MNGTATHPSCVDCAHAWPMFFRLEAFPADFFDCAHAQIAQRRAIPVG